MNGKFTEKELEQAVIELFEKQDYVHVYGSSIHRKTDEILLLDDLREYLAERYQAEGLSETETQKIINRLALIHASPLYLGNREAFRLVNGGFDLARDDVSKVALHVEYIDFDHPEKNRFKVVNQYAVQGGQLRVPDLLLFVNGIPVAVFEFKSAIAEDATIYDAWKQITVRYCRDIPNLMKYCFLSVICDGANTRLGAIFTPYEYYYAWSRVNDGDADSGGVGSLLTMIEGAFSKGRVTAILRDFVFYPDNSRRNEAIVCRYPQFFGARKMMESIRAHMRPDGNGKGGVYFGATGCGKTYTMLFLSRLLIQRDNAAFRNPTVIILTDREDLDSQTSALFVTAKQYLHEDDVRSIESREDLEATLKNRPSGGVYVTTIQKFCKDTGLLSDRANIICVSDEAHRTQTGVESSLKRNEGGVFHTYGFAHYLRASFPNAVYCGFTGTPIDETLAVFGDIVDRYTMKQASDDGITVRIAYEPRLARVIVSDGQAKEIERYYEQCAAEGSTEEQIAESKRAMSRMSRILSNPDRLHKLAADIAEHYEALCAEKPNVVQKAMIVCADRSIAFQLLNEILAARPDWGVARRAEDESVLTKDRLDRLTPLPKINLVATRDKDDAPELYRLCGTKEYRETLERQFKNADSNFKIAVVVDMWITGFDVPSLAVMYIDKPLRKHTLIQTISRVNRVFDGKEKGLVVDYIGIRRDMLEAVRQYGDPQESPVDELALSLEIFRNHLSLIGALFVSFDASRFYVGTPLERLRCLNAAAEYAQISAERQTRFMGLSRRLKSASAICVPSGELTAEEIAGAQFYLAVRSIIYKQTKGGAPDAETMNRVVENMVRDAIACTGIEDIIGGRKREDLFSDEFLAELRKVNMPVTRFNALLKLLRKAISDYGQTNKVKAMAFDEQLKRIVEKYNQRNGLAFVSGVVADFIDDLSEKLIQILRNLQSDKSSFEKMGITYEEKAFYDILVKVRDDRGFPYAEEKCLVLAKEIKELVDDKARYADWSTRNDIKNQLNMSLTVLLYRYGYPPEWDEEVFEKVMEQAENFKKCKSFPA